LAERRPLSRLLSSQLLSFTCPSKTKLIHFFSRPAAVAQRWNN
jgi:hypothetical protein